MLKFMTFHVRHVALLMVMMLVSSFVALAAERIPIPASPNGPSASLKSSHRSVYLLTALEREDGSKLDPSDNGTWKDKKFYLPKSAKPNKGTYRQFIAATHKTHRSSVRKSSPPAPSACPPTSEPKMAEKSVSHAEVVVPTNYVIKVGEKVNFDGFKKTDGSLVTDLQYEESMAGVASLAAYQGTVTIRPLKPGKVIFTLWVNGDESVKREVTIEVAELATNGPKPGSTIFIPLLGLFVVFFVLFVVVFIMRSQGSKPLVQTLQEEPAEEGYDEVGENATAQQPDSDDGFQRIEL